MRGQRLLLVATVALTVLVAGCAQQGGTTDGGDEAPTELTIQADEWSLLPSTATVPVGEEITVTFENTGSNQHNVGIDVDGDGETEDDVRTETIAAGQTATFTVTIDEPGEYAYFCDVSGHRGAGMEGTLTAR